MKGLTWTRTVHALSPTGSPSATNRSRVKPLSMSAWLSAMSCTVYSRFSGYSVTTGLPLRVTGNTARCAV
ncbi:hypothetical protein D3C78_1814520 [compost metagenome]